MRTAAMLHHLNRCSVFRFLIIIRRTLWRTQYKNRRVFVHLIYAHQTKMLNVFLPVFAWGKRAKDKQKLFFRWFFFHLFGHTLRTFMFAIENWEGNKLRIKIESKHKIPFANFSNISLKRAPVRSQIYTWRMYWAIWARCFGREKRRNFSFYLCLLIDAAWKWGEKCDE